MGRRDGTLKQTLRTMSCSGLIEISNLGARIPVPSAGRGRLTADRGASIRPVVGYVLSLVAQRPWPSLSSPPTRRVPRWTVSGPEPIILG